MNQHEANKRVAARIRELRLAREIGQAELGRRIGLKTPMSMSRYEAGATTIPEHRLVRIAKELDVTLVDLLGGGDVAPASIEDVRRDLRELAHRMLDAAFDATPEALERARDALDAHLRRIGR